MEPVGAAAELSAHLVRYTIFGPEAAVNDHDHHLRATLQDVALRAGVSRSTASFVLTGRQDMRVAAATQQRVLQMAKELDYRPNLVARSLRTSRSITFGLISDGIAADPFAGEVIRGSLTTAALHQHLLFVGETGDDPAAVRQLAYNMLDRGVGGFIYATTHTRQVTLPEVLRDQPVVLVNCLAREAGIPMVVPDEFEAGKTAARALLAYGHHNRIVLVGETPQQVIAATRRLAGIDHVLSGSGLTLEAQLPTPWLPEPAYLAVREYLSAGHRPSAFLCLNDRVALGVYLAIRDARLTVPDDVSVISFDDSDLAGWLQPGLTSVAIPHFELGRRGVELLLDAKRPGGVHRIPMTLHDRNSISAPSRAGASVVS